MTSPHGFELIRDETIAEINSRARLYRHIKTGAQLLSMENDDENKVFGITFATPPTDSTGLPHIMEHSVLCGSRKYPLKEPFVELLKGSLKTFLNAFTFSDKTCYPVASQNTQDFYNLIDVYLDAVFYPRITPHTLQQEGWHYELETLDQPLVYKGVVFNEMKGAYSSPDNVLYRYSERSLFPDTVYGVDSGGDPREIPDLTYEQFKRFHETYYHPSNAFIWFYGDDDPEQRLAIVDGYLRDFDALNVDRSIPLQPRFEQPARVVYDYDAGEDGATGNKGMVTVNWLLNEVTDVETTLALQILGYILVGTPASPLRKALIDSGLGEDVTGAGLADDQREVYFSTGLKGIAVADADQVEQLIFDTLKGLVRDGIDPDMVEAALNTVEFRLRENNTGAYPRGLILMINALSTWLYNADPLARLAYEEPLQSIKDAASKRRYFEGLIDSYLLNNPHRTTVLFKPDATLRAREDAVERDRLAQVRDSLSESELQAIIDNTRELKRMQEAPDSLEALATIPSLTLGDLDREIKRIPAEVSKVHEATLLYHDLFTNGIVYVDLGFDLRVLPQETLPYVSLFSDALLEIGTETEDFVRLSQRIGRKTGGIRATTMATSVWDAPRSTAWLFLRGKSTMSQADDLLAILRDVLLTVKLDNPGRFKQMALEAKAGLEAALVPSGHQIANTRLKSHFSEADWLNEQMGGVTQLLFLRSLSDQIDRDWPSVLAHLENIRQMLVNRAAMIINVTLDGDNWQKLQPKVAAFVRELPTNGAEPAAWSPTFSRQNEGLAIPTQVNYVAKGANLYELGYQLHGSASVITNYLRTTWLWERVRVQGGAYGGFCTFDKRSGLFSYLSYRDPNLTGTLDNYDNAADFLRRLELGEGELTKGIIGAIGEMDTYQLPDAKGFTSMIHYLTGETDERRQQLRNEVLGTTEANFRRFGEALAEVSAHGQVVVLGAQDAIEAANEARPELDLQVQRVL